MMRACEFRSQDRPSVVIVEDSDQMRSLIRIIVSPFARVVGECSDGAEALQAVAQHQPDWVLMDIEMPKVDGITALGRIKASFQSVKVLIVTQYDDVRMREAAKSAGADGYLLKDDLMEIPRFLTGRNDP
jgi:DNA-binding NarL/FixJ family response regulator